MYYSCRNGFDSILEWEWDCDYSSSPLLMSFLASLAVSTFGLCLAMYCVGNTMRHARGMLYYGYTHYASALVIQDHALYEQYTQACYRLKVCLLQCWVV